MRQKREGGESGRRTKGEEKKSERESREGGKAR
jgi:hypothetical protein